MYTLDELKEILDAEDSNTLDGYNVIRTNIMTKAAEAITELETANATLENLKKENERLKAANMTLYSRVESQIMKKEEDGKKEEGGKGEEEDEERDDEKELEANITAYKDI